MCIKEENIANWVNIVYTERNQRSSLLRIYDVNRMGYKYTFIFINIKKNSIAEIEHEHPTKSRLADT